MNPVFKEYVIDFADLKLVSVVCGKCKTEIIIDMTGELILIPNVCQSCGNLINQVFLDALTSFYKIYKYLSAKDLNSSARIRIRQESNMSEF